MIFFTLNSGSSSIKFRMIDMPEGVTLLRGIVDGIGQEKSFIEIKEDGQTIKKDTKVKNHEDAAALLFENLKNCKASVKKIDAIGHRVVHGGEKYKSAVLVTDEVLKDIESLCDIAPLHNPANLKGIIACQKTLANVPNIVIFDTAFHQTIPANAYLYGLPYELYEKFRIRKYGFHGISHKYVANEAMRLLKREITSSKIITCHLGAGASITAIQDGKSVETSMGFTPLDGLIMGTRAGSFDPEIIIFLLNKGYKKEEIEEILQKKSGLKGISQRSNDVRELREAELHGDQKSELAFEMFEHRAQMFVGAYAAVMNGLDVLVFTGGAGEKAYFLREMICEKLKFLGVNIDQDKNKENDTVISTNESRVAVLVVPTNEELQIAREGFVLLEKSVFIGNLLRK